MKNLLVIDPSPQAFMLICTLVLTSYQPLHAETPVVADYAIRSEWPDVIVVDPLISPMDSATVLVQECAAIAPTVVWTAVSPAALPCCPCLIVVKQNTLRLAAWLEGHPP